MRLDHHEGLRSGARLLCALALVSLPSLSMAQSILGAVTGTVTDASGSVVPGVNVTLTNSMTKVARTVTTDTKGDFLAPNLDAGAYTWKCEVSGFAPRSAAVDLLARQIVRVDARLELAATSENVEVAAAHPVIETESTTVSNSKSGAEIASLALNFRATSDTSP